MVPSPSSRSQSPATGYSVYTHSYFGGAQTAPDRASVDQRGALLAQNVRYFGKQVQTRYGWGVAISFAASASGGGFGLFNWLSELGNYLFWSNFNTGATLYATKVSDNPPTLIAVFTTVIETIVFPSFAPAGPRLYVAWWNRDSVGNAYGSARTAVVTQTAGTFHYDHIIPGPPSTTLIPATPPTEPGAGIVTAGIHNIGLRMQHRSGFLGRPGPDSSTSTNPTPQTFAPIVFTATGGKNLQWAFTPPGGVGGVWPADVVSVEMVMSPVANPNRYFLVPGAVQAVTGGAATAVTFIINIDDGTLVSSAASLECTNSLNYYTASATDTSGIFARVVREIGGRMFYNTTFPDNSGSTYSVLLASEIGDYQALSASQHAVQLPGQLTITTVFSILGAIYIVGPHWTYSTQDNGQTPINWSTPTIVDGRKGALYANLVEVASSGRYAWIADKTGLYYFDGAFSPLPISYLQQDLWDSINLLDPITISVKDDPINHRVIVHASQLGDYIWDYTNGFDPYSARFSTQDSAKITNLASAQISSCGAIEIVQNDLFGNNTKAQKASELWGIAANTDLPGTLFISRQKNPSDTNLYRDAGTIDNPVHALYRTCIMPAPAGSENDTISHIAAKVRIVGAGAIQPKLYNFDLTANISLFPSTNLATIPSGGVDFRGFLNTQNGYVYEFEQAVLDGHFTLTEIDSYFTRFGSLF